MRYRRGTLHAMIPPTKDVDVAPLMGTAAREGAEDERALDSLQPFERRANSPADPPGLRGDGSKFREEGARRYATPSSAIGAATELATRIETMLNAGTGPWMPFNASSPTASETTLSSARASTRWDTSTCPAAACVHNRAARLFTAP